MGNSEKILHEIVKIRELLELIAEEKLVMSDEEIENYELTEDEIQELVDQDELFEIRHGEVVT